MENLPSDVFRLVFDEKLAERRGSTLYLLIQSNQELSKDESPVIGGWLDQEFPCSTNRLNRKGMNVFVANLTKLFLQGEEMFTFF